MTVREFIEQMKPGEQLHTDCMMDGKEVSPARYLYNHIDKVTKTKGVYFLTLLSKVYRYTYKCRGFSIGCQPSDGLIEHKEGCGYDFGILLYKRELTQEEIDNYELIDLNEDLSKYTSNMNQGMG
jgi:hypothetical protein